MGKFTILKIKCIKKKHKEHYKILLNPTCEVDSIRIVSNHMSECSWDCMVAG